MIIKETKTKFIAICSVDGEGKTLFKVGDSMGSISKSTRKFNGATVCLIELNNALDENLEQKSDELITKVIEEIKNDLNSGDLTALYELLKIIPTANLEAYLPELES